MVGIALASRTLLLAELLGNTVFATATNSSEAESVRPLVAADFCLVDSFHGGISSRTKQILEDFPKSISWRHFSLSWEHLGSPNCFRMSENRERARLARTRLAGRMDILHASRSNKLRPGRYARNWTRRLHSLELGGTGPPQKNDPTLQGTKGFSVFFLRRDQFMKQLTRKVLEWAYLFEGCHFCW